MQNKSFKELVKHRKILFKLSFNVYRYNIIYMLLREKHLLLVFISLVNYIMKNINVGFVGNLIK